MTLRLFDTRRAEKLPFEPLAAPNVGLYVCGVTPYDTGHLGHAFTYVSFDVLHRFLEYRGYRVTYVQNLTDVDDDLLRRARELSEDYLHLGNRHVTAFLTEMAALNWLPPDRYPRATQHIQRMQELITALLAKGHAYVAEGNVYYDVDSRPEFGELSHLPREAMLPIANERGNVPDMPGKRRPLDFVLWQPSLPDEPSWPSPWGPGRPGWHIECSAMSTAYLGPQLDIHGGGGDLVFPHHEAEIAQSEGASGKRPFVNFWLHAGMLSYRGEKMSKSLGNLVLVRDLLASYPGDAIRHYLVSHHYRDEIDYDEADIDASVTQATLLRRACQLAEELSPLDPALADPARLHPSVAERRERFLAAMDDDLDTPSALPELHALAGMCQRDSPPEVVAQAGWLIRELGARILGLRLATVPTIREAAGEPAEVTVA